MVFTNVLTEQEVVESLIKESGVESGFIFKSYYDEENLTQTILKSITKI